MAVIDLAGLTASGDGFRLIGDAASDSAGISVASAGDINGDGLADFGVSVHLLGGSLVAGDFIL